VPPPFPRSEFSRHRRNIAGVQSNDGSAEYKSGEVSVEDLLIAIPQARTIAEVSAEQVSNIGSQNMTNVWLKLAHRLNEVLSDSSLDGVVITHGTDTMEETAYFLSLVAKSDKPIVMVGPMRPATAISADGPMNLSNAITIAASSEAEACWWSTTAKFTSREKWKKPTAPDWTALSRPTGVAPE